MSPTNQTGTPLLHLQSIAGNGAVTGEIVRRSAGTGPVGDSR